MTNLDSILKSRDITLSTKVCLVKAMVFPVVMYRCEGWTIKKKLSTKELMLLNCGVGEDSFCSLLLLLLFTLQYCICHTLTCICHGCTCVPHPEPLSHLPPHTIPLGHPSAPAPSFLYPASNLDWRFASYMILYMF